MENIATLHLEKQTTIFASKTSTRMCVCVRVLTGTEQQQDRFQWQGQVFETFSGVCLLSMLFKLLFATFELKISAQRLLLLSFSTNIICEYIREALNYLRMYVTFSDQRWKSLKFSVVSSHYVFSLKSGGQEFIIASYFSFFFKFLLRITHILDKKCCRQLTMERLPHHINS